MSEDERAERRRRIAGWIAAIGGISIFLIGILTAIYWGYKVYQGSDRTGPVGEDLAWALLFLLSLVVAFVGPVLWLFFLGALRLLSLLFRWATNGRDH